MVYDVPSTATAFASDVRISISSRRRCLSPRPECIQQIRHHTVVPTGMRIKDFSCCFRPVGFGPLHLDVVARQALKGINDF